MTDHTEKATKRVILPMRLTEEMRDAAATAMATCPQDGHEADFSCGYLEAVAASPNAGKVSEAEFIAAVGEMRKYYHENPDPTWGGVLRAALVPLGLEVEV